jgi:hypothetical protein
MSYTVTKVDIWSSKIEDKPGSLAKVLGTLGNAGANLDCVIDKKFVAYLGFESAADATKAARALKTLASPKKAGKGKR